MMPMNGVHVAKQLIHSSLVASCLLCSSCLLHNKQGIPQNEQEQSTPIRTHSEADGRPPSSPERSLNISSSPVSGRTPRRYQRSWRQTDDRLDKGPNTNGFWRMNTISTNKRITNKRDLISALNSMDFKTFDVQEVQDRSGISTVSKSLNRFATNKALTATVIVIERKE